MVVCVAGSVNMCVGHTGNVGRSGFTGVMDFCSNLCFLPVLLKHDCVHTSWAEVLLTCRFAFRGWRWWEGVTNFCISNHLLDATAPCTILRCHQATGTRDGPGTHHSAPSQPAPGREPRPLPPALEAVAVLGAPWLPRGPYSLPPMFYRLCEGSSGIEGRQQVGLMCLGNSCSSGASSHNSFAKLWP